MLKESRKKRVICIVASSSLRLWFSDTGKLKPPTLYYIVINIIAFAHVFNLVLIFVLIDNVALVLIYDFAKKSLDKQATSLAYL